MMREMSHRRGRSLLSAWLFAGFCVSVAAGAFLMQRSVLEAELLGYDGYALILASRIQNRSDLLGTFTEVMMDGRLAAGDFYRPLANLFLAADHATWGLEPFGYQLTSLLLWCATVLLLPWLVWRVIGPGCWYGAVVAALFYALHPASLSILPYVARRPETLALLFTAGALCVLPRDPSQGGILRYLVAGLLAGSAMASKESGILAVGLIFLHQLMAASRRGAGGAVRTAVRAALPAAVFSAVLFGSRLLVIGGIGGYHEAKQQSTLEKLLHWAPEYLATTLRSESLGGPGLDHAVPLAALAALAIFSLNLLRLERRPGSEILPRISPLLVLGTLWLLAQVVLACASLHFTTRYLLGMSFSTALVLGALTEGAARAVRRDGRWRRLQAAVTLVLVLGISLLALRGSPAVRAYPELMQASRTQSQLLSALSMRIQMTAPYEYIELELPRRVPVASIGVDSFWMISHWGLQAWLELSVPERPYRVLLKREEARFEEDFSTVTLSPSGSGKL